MNSLTNLPPHFILLFFRSYHRSHAILIRVEKHAICNMDFVQQFENRRIGLGTTDGYFSRDYGVYVRINDKVTFRSVHDIILYVVSGKRA